MNEREIRLEQNVNDFVNEYKNCPDQEITKIIAGMTAIIEGNENLYERLKNQRWFERIWYGLTLKNRATVNEMKSRREDLSKYTIQTLNKMNETLTLQDRCILDLYRAICVVRHNIDGLTDEVNSLAIKLNEKINSLDMYLWLLTEIRNEKFDVATPLLSLIVIMSFIDSRTAKDDKKLTQLKETMEQVGFDFSKKVDILDYSNDVLSLTEDSVGRLLLFCRNFSNRSRLFEYTCILMESSIFLWDSDKTIVRESGEIIDEAMKSLNIKPSTSFKLQDIYNEINTYLDKLN